MCTFWIVVVFSHQQVKWSINQVDSKQALFTEEKIELKRIFSWGFIKVTPLNNRIQKGGIYTILFFSNRSFLYGAFIEMVGAYLNTKPNSTVIGDGSKEQLTAIGYTRSYLKTFVFHCISILCMGFPYVLIYWHDVFGIQWQYVQCPISEAQALILEVRLRFSFQFLLLKHIYRFFCYFFF